MDAIETKTVKRDGRTITASRSLPHEDAPNPLEEWSEMGTILSLNRRHANFDPAGIEAAMEGNPDAVPLGISSPGAACGAWRANFPPPALPVGFGRLRRHLAARCRNARIRQELRRQRPAFIHAEAPAAGVPNLHPLVQRRGLRLPD